MKKYLYFLLFLLSYSIQSQTYESKVFNNKNGLLENEVFNIFLDSKGFLWIHTPRALHVYDGKTIKLFPDKVLSPLELNDGLIHATGNDCIKKYSSSKLVETLKTGIKEEFYVANIGATIKATKWFDKDGALYYYFPYNKDKKDTLQLLINGNTRFISLVTEIKQGFEPRLFLDNNKTIWLCLENKKTGEKKLSFFKNGSPIPSPVKINSKDPIGNIFTTRKNEQYIYTKSIIYKVSGNSVSEINVPKEVGNYFFEYSGNKCEDSKGNIWMPYEKGLFKISGASTELIVDYQPRIMACDSMIESSFDEKGKQTITKTWQCDARVFIYGIGIDSKDNIYTGNKVYENGKFSEVFKANGEIIIYQILADQENNIWYGTSMGLFRFHPLPLKNISVSHNIRGYFNQVDNDEHLYTEAPPAKKGWTNVNKLLVYKHDRTTDNYFLKDSFLIRDEGPFDPLTDLNSRFMEIIPMKKGVLVLVEDIGYYYNGASVKKQYMDQLKLSEDKILDKFSKNKKIKRNTIFRDHEGYIWFYYDGNYIKTDGLEYKCFGREAGIKDTLDIIEANFGHFQFEKLVNRICLNNEFYILNNDRFTSVKYKSKGLNVNGFRANAFGNIDAPYFFFDSLAASDGKNIFSKFENGQFIRYTIENPDKLRLIFNGVYPINNKYILNLKQDGFAKIEIDDRSKKVVFKRINLSSQYTGDNARYTLLNEKLFAFSGFGAMNIFPVDSSTLEIKEPLSLPEYSVFYDLPIIRRNRIYIRNTGDFGEHTSWLLRLDAKGEYFNKVQPKLNIVSVSYENNDTLTELFNGFNDIEIPYHFNPLKINFKGICLSDGSKVKYKYLLEGFEEKWNLITEDNVTYSSLPPGQYTFKLMACNDNGIWTVTPTQFTFTVLPPWNRTWWAYTMYLFAGFAAIRGYLKNRTKKLEKEKEKLEKTVKERTAEVVAQKHLLEEKQKEIIDSITYARRIQRSLMPTDKYISKVLGKKK